MSMTQEEIDALLSGAQDSAPEAGTAEQPTIEVDTPAFGEIDVPGNPPGGINLNPLDPKLDMLYDLQLMVSIELGRTNMLIRDILRLGRGSVIEFDKLVSEPVDVLVNGKKVAEGEVVVIDKHFGIRITSLVDPSDRLRSLKK
ncbi:MAG: flagellar motor switch protein FliN [Candidatus Kapabacteria bacterium]|nr:flagellar motor switch protein FliN [Candidatus Kapabacteria bacterium]MBX7156115.1 flagellar motor switch protein FliN [Bacteroidota bacterium]